MSRLGEMFDHFDELRESGITNMYGAAPFLASHFGLERRESHRVLSAWMSTFDGFSPADERAAKALDEDPSLDEI